VQKTRISSESFPLRIKLPSKKVRERFYVIYELEGCQKAANYLTKYYGVRRMRIILNGRKVGKGGIGCYLEDCAYFKKEGLKKRIVLHELYHHLIEKKGIEIHLRTEEKEANTYAKRFFNN
jgi:hypothetical protein